MARGGTQLPRAARLAVSLAASLLAFSVTILGLLLVTFVLGRMMPIDPALVLVGDRATPDVYEQARESLGLDRPIWVQFFLYVGNVLQGNLGYSAITSKPVVVDLARVFAATIELATLSTLIGVVFGVPLGVVAAAHHNSWIDHVARIAGLLGHSVPVFWLGLIGLIIFYGQLGWVAGPGRLSIAYEFTVPAVTGFVLVDTALSGSWSAFVDALSHLILPAAVLGYYSMAFISRMTRGLYLEQLQQEYVITARVKGISDRRILWTHVLRNVRVSLLTVIALTYGMLLEGAVLTETVFAWPGLGQYITQSLLAADMNAVLGGTMLVGLVFLCLNTMADALYRIFDPRTK